MKQNLAVVFGGRSVEHDVSIITGAQLMDNADASKYNIIPIYIARDGAWYTGARLRDVDFFKHFDPQDKGVIAVGMVPASGRAVLRPLQQKTGLFAKRSEDIAIDVVIPAMHGLNGEDGTLQGLFELVNVPYASAGVLGSAVGMDKVMMKAVFKASGFPVLEAVDFTRARFEKEREQVLDEVERALPYPIFIKPANLGSSIGISRAVDRASLAEAIDVAVRYDRRILAERGVSQLKEINCSVLGYGGDARASLCEEPVSWKEFLTFDQKYLRGGKGAKGGMQSLQRKLPAPISEEMTGRIQDLAVRVFAALDLKGVVRIDFIIDEADGALYVNEVNTIPGSFAFYLWEPLGVTFKDLVDELVAIAQRAHAEKNANDYAFDSRILDKFQSGGGKLAK
nr:D-alanine--D-alanine ligase family protein [Maliibacterium massiliense]